MSSKTKIVVLKSKELIYTGIFVVLGILLILLLFYMFSPTKTEDETQKTTTTSTTEDTQTTATMTTYKPGVYTSELNLGGSSMQLSVTVDKDAVAHVEITNLDETVTAMYPLIEPSLEEINNQISTATSIDNITYSSDNKYTSIIILEAIKDALKDAVVTD